MYRHPFYLIKYQGCYCQKVCFVRSKNTIVLQNFWICLRMSKHIIKCSTACVKMHEIKKGLVCCSLWTDHCISALFIHFWNITLYASPSHLCVPVTHCHLFFFLLCRGPSPFYCVLSFSIPSPSYFLSSSLPLE